MTTPLSSVEQPARNGDSALRRSGDVVLLYLLSRLLVMSTLWLTARVKHQPLVNFLHGWDGYWYLSVARSGYVTSIPPGHGNIAQCNLGFFPLLPLLLRGAHWLAGGNWTVDGLVLNTLAGSLAAVVVYVMAVKHFGHLGARRGVALMVLSPGSVVLSMIYAETYIVLFVALTLWALQERRWVVAGLAAAAASALDPVGVVAFLPCAYVAWHEIHHNRHWRALAAPVLAPLGVTLFFTYLAFHTGSFFAYAHAQRAGWQQGIFGTGVFYAMGQVVLHFTSAFNSIVKTLSFAGGVAMLWWAWRRRITMTWMSYVLGVMLMGVISPIIGITPRLLLRGFPLLVAVGATVTRRWFVTMLSLSIVGLIGLSIASTGLTWTP